MSAQVQARMAFAKRFGSQLVLRRKAARVKRSQVAAGLGIHRNTLRNWELGLLVPDVYQWQRLNGFLRMREATAEVKAGAKP